MSVLIDTSVWVQHFRRRDAALADLVSADLALTHPMVVAELACGTPPEPRARTLSDIELLQPARQASLREIMDLVERETLYGLGCGLIDLALLGSTLITPAAVLWTRDKHLAALAARFGVAYAPGRR